MSLHEALGLSINVYRPTFAPYVPNAFYLGRFDLASYEHTLSVGYGYDTMRCTMTASREQADYWLTNGCGAHVEVRDETDIIIWEGRINTVSVQAGGSSAQRGPLKDIANRCVVTYQLLNTDTNEGQEEKRTDPANNTASQAKYGIQYQILNGGTVTTTRANQVRDAYVAYRAWPRMPKQIALGGGDVAVSLDCLGYAHWLDYPYRLANVMGTVTISAKLTALLAADPNGFFSTGLNQIMTNTLTVQQLEDQDRIAGEIVADLVAMGDSTYNRYLFGIWAGRVARYVAAPTAVEYQQRTDDKRQIIEDMAGNVIQPWSVLPGKWITLTNVLPGALVGMNMTGMPETERSLFIERVSYSTPYNLTLQSGEVNNLRQALAQWGVTGI